MKEIYPTLEKFVSRDAFTWIVKDCLSRSDMEAIAAQCRIETRTGPGVTSASDTVAREISAEFYKNPKARELIGYYLNASTQSERDIVSITPVTDLLAKLRDPQSPMIETGKVGRYLWAFLVDERPEIMALIPIFILKVLETIRKFTSILQQIKKDEPMPRKGAGVPAPKPAPIPRIPSKLEEDLMRTKREINEARADLEKLEGRNAQFESRIQELQGQYKAALSETQQLKHDKNMAAKRMKELEQTIEDMKVRNQGIEETRSRLHQLERENKMLRYEVEKKTEELQSLQDLNSERARHIKIAGHHELKIKELERTIQDRDAEIVRLKSAFKQENVAKKVQRKVFRSTIPRVGIFVDVQNIYYAAKEKYDAKLDFQRLLHDTLQGRRLVKAVAYVVKTPEISQTNFLATLESIGYEIKARNLKIRMDGSAKGDWDLGIAIDTISTADKLDVVVLVSGDGDFVDLVRMLKTRNIRVEVASFPHNTSGDLIDAVDCHFVLDERILLPKG